MLYATIMAGGSGTRFWPASRRDRPKQLLTLFGEQSMLQGTVARLEGLVDAGRILVMTNERLVAATRNQLPQLPDGAIMGEPCKRDTAPCIALAAGVIARRDPEATMLVTPADHVIQAVDRFQQAVHRGEQLIAEDPSRIVAFGITPSRPSEAFGYIERGESIGDDAWKVIRFREKPDAATAREFLQSGRFYWNAGIFMWRCQTILDALQEFEPEMMKRVARIVDAVAGGQFDQVLQQEFPAIEGKSIDYAVMEHYDNVCVIAAPFDWDDAGNWATIPQISGMDADRNSTAGRVLAIDSSGCIVRSDGNHLVVTLGLSDCIVVHTPDATLVAPVSSESAIRRVVEELESRHLDAYL